MSEIFRYATAFSLIGLFGLFVLLHMCFFTHRWDKLPEVILKTLTIILCLLADIGLTIGILGYIVGFYLYLAK